MGAWRTSMIRSTPAKTATCITTSRDRDGNQRAPQPTATPHQRTLPTSIVIAWHAIVVPTWTICVRTMQARLRNSTAATMTIASRGIWAASGNRQAVVVSAAVAGFAGTEAPAGIAWQGQTRDADQERAGHRLGALSEPASIQRKRPPVEGGLFLLSYG